MIDVVVNKHSHSSRELRKGSGTHKEEACQQTISLLARGVYSTVYRTKGNGLRGSRDQHVHSKKRRVHRVKKVVDIKSFQLDIKGIKDELEKLLVCSNEHFVRYYDYKITEEEISITMEKLDYTLEDLVRIDPLPESAILPVMKTVLNGLNYLHSMKLYHTQISAENILLSTKGKIKLKNFGRNISFFDFDYSKKIPIFHNNAEYDIWCVGRLCCVLTTGFIVARDRVPKIKEEYSCTEDFIDFINCCLGCKLSIKELLEHDFIKRESDEALLTTTFRRISRYHPNYFRLSYIPPQTMEHPPKLGSAPLGLDVSGDHSQLSSSSLHVEPHRNSGISRSKGAPIEWNEEFQKISSMNTSNKRFKNQKYTRLRELAHDFIHSAQMYGQIIISEAFLQDKHKTIKPVALNGEAGGKKYVHSGILFKFALDHKNIYGSDEFAMKAASHELRGCVHVYRCCDLYDLDLRVPLMTLIDYRGFRLICVSILPISENSLLYGSNDSGQNVVNKNRELSKQLEILGKKLNLKKHIAGSRKTAEIDLCCDFEGHLSEEDNHFYLLDFARVFPCSAPEKADPQSSYLYKLFRPEFLRTYPVPLSPDAFSVFAKHDPKKEEHENEIKEATRVLVEERIPQFVTEMDGNFAEFSARSYSQLGAELHRNGINLRYLGLIRSLSQNKDVKRLLLHEIVARSVKNDLRKKLRETMKVLKTVSTEHYKNVIIKILNRIVSGRTSRFWTEFIKHSVNLRFPKALDQHEISKEYSLKDDIDVYKLFVRVINLNNITITENTMKNLKESPEDICIVYADVESMQPRVKDMNIVSHAEASALFFEAMRRDFNDRLQDSISGAVGPEDRKKLGSSNPSATEEENPVMRLLHTAEKKYRDAIASTPNDSVLLKEYAETLKQLAYRKIKWTETVKLLGDVFTLQKLADEHRKKRDHKDMLVLADELMGRAKLWFFQVPKCQKQLLKLCSDCFLYIINSAKTSNLIDPDIYFKFAICTLQRSMFHGKSSDRIRSDAERRFNKLLELIAKDPESKYKDIASFNSKPSRRNEYPICDAIKKSPKYQRFLFIPIDQLSSRKKKTDPSNYPETITFGKLKRMNQIDKNNIQLEMNHVQKEKKHRRKISSAKGDRRNSELPNTLPKDDGEIIRSHTDTTRSLTRRLSWGEEYRLKRCKTIPQRAHKCKAKKVSMVGDKSGELAGLENLKRSRDDLDEPTTAGGAIFPPSPMIPSERRNTVSERNIAEPIVVCEGK